MAGMSFTWHLTGTAFDGGRVGMDFERRMAAMNFQWSMTGMAFEWPMRARNYLDWLDTLHGQMWFAPEKCWPGHVILEVVNPASMLSLYLDPPQEVVPPWEKLPGLNHMESFFRRMEPVAERLGRFLFRMENECSYQYNVRESREFRSGDWSMEILRAIDRKGFVHDEDILGLVMDECRGLLLIRVGEGLKITFHGEDTIWREIEEALGIVGGNFDEVHVDVERYLKKGGPLPWKEMTEGVVWNWLADAGRDSGILHLAMTSTPLMRIGPPVNRIWRRDPRSGQPAKVLDCFFQDLRDFLARDAAYEFLAVEAGEGDWRLESLVKFRPERWHTGEGGILDGVKDGKNTLAGVVMRVPGEMVLIHGGGALRIACHGDSHGYLHALLEWKDWGRGVVDPEAWQDWRPAIREGWSRSPERGRVVSTTAEAMKEWLEGAVTAEGMFDPGLLGAGHVIVKVVNELPRAVFHVDPPGTADMRWEKLPGLTWLASLERHLVPVLERHLTFGFWASAAEEGGEKGAIHVWEPGNMQLRSRVESLGTGGDQGGNRVSGMVLGARRGVLVCRAGKGLEIMYHGEEMLWEEIAECLGRGR